MKQKFVKLNNYIFLPKDKRFFKSYIGISAQECQNHCYDLRKFGCYYAVHVPSKKYCYLGSNYEGGGEPYLGGTTYISVPDSEYANLTNFDIPGGDLKKYSGINSDVCKMICNRTKGCVGAVTEPSNNNCWLKKEIVKGHGHSDRVLHVK